MKTLKRFSALLLAVFLAASSLVAGLAIVRNDSHTITETEILEEKGSVIRQRIRLASGHTYQAVLMRTEAKAAGEVAHYEHHWCGFHLLCFLGIVSLLSLMFSLVASTLFAFQQALLLGACFSSRPFFSNAGTYLYGLLSNPS